MFKQLKYFCIVFLVIIAPLQAKNFSGLYQGEDCKGDCNFQTAAQDPINSLTQALGLTSKYASFFIEHIDESSKMIINHLNTNKIFETKFNRENLTFEGLNSTKGQIYSIKGSFNGDMVSLTITREKKKDGTSSFKDHFMATRTAYSTKSAEIIELQINEKKNIDQENSLLSNEVDEANNTITKLEREINSLKKQLAKPAKIDTTNLDSSSTVAKEVDLMTKPNSKEGKKILTLEEGALINHLMPVPPERSWSLITTESGIIGYIKNVNIIDSNAYSEPTATEPSPVTEGQIVIYEPAWDKGKKNQLITLTADGFVSIQGMANIDNLEKVYINDEEVEVYGNDFSTVIMIEEGNNNIKVSSEDVDGKQTELNFIIKVK